jgi:Sec-independent protein translocase protein TatA
MGLIEFLLLAAVAYLVWRISDQLPDLLFRISEIQRDVADIRKRLTEVEESTKTKKSVRRKAAKKSPVAKSSAAKKITAKASEAKAGAAESDDKTNADEPSS